MVLDGCLGPTHSVVGPLVRTPVSRSSSSNPHSDPETCVGSGGPESTPRLPGPKKTMSTDNTPSSNSTYSSLGPGVLSWKVLGVSLWCFVTLSDGWDGDGTSNRSCPWSRGGGLGPPVTEERRQGYGSQFLRVGHGSLTNSESYETQFTHLP